MIRSRYQIEIKERVKIELLFTLSLFGVASKRKINLALDDPSDANARISFFLKLIYCGAINAWEYQRMEDATMGDFPYSLLDVAEWGGNHPREFAEIIKGASAAISGSDLPEGASEADAAEDVKKK